MPGGQQQSGSSDHVTSLPVWFRSHRSGHADDDWAQQRQQNIGNGIGYREPKHGCCAFGYPLAANIAASCVIDPASAPHRMTGFMRRT